MHGCFRQTSSAHKLATVVIILYIILYVFRLIFCSTKMTYTMEVYFIHIVHPLNLKASFPFISVCCENVILLSSSTAAESTDRLENHC